MQSNFLRLLTLVTCIAAAALPASGYDLIYGQEGKRVTWNGGSIPFVIRMSQTANLQDGSSYASSVQAAMNAWNGQITVVQFSSSVAAAGLANNGDGVNEIVFDTKIYSNSTDPENPPEEFGANTLAVTLSWTATTPRQDGTYQRTQSDILFNSKWNWGSYRGSLQQPEDIRRVAIHELGHVLGLDHPDEDGQSVTAIMNSTVSNIDALQTDDLTGAQFLYGRPGGFTAPSNDNFASAAMLTLSSNAGTLTASNVGATKESGEPTHLTTAEGASVWWKWTAPASGSITINTLGSHFDTILAAYAGSTVGSLNQLAANDDAGDNSGSSERRSTITFNVSGGTTYHIAAVGWDAQWGHIVLNASFNEVTPPAITVQPIDRTVASGSYVTFSVTVSGTSLFTYEWQSAPAGSDTWTTVSRSTGAGTTSSYSLYPDLSDIGRRYRCVVSNSGGSVTSNAATLTVTGDVPKIYSQPWSTTISEGNSASFYVYALGSSPVTYRWQVSAAGSGTWTNLENSTYYSGATEPSMFVLVPPLNYSGNRYRCVVSNPLGTVTTEPVTLTIDAARPPVFYYTNPQTYTFNYGEWLSLSASLSSGTSPVTYQWFKDGVALSGQTSSSFYRSSATVADSGTYTVQATNVAGSALSATITVVVRQAVAPTITQQPAALTTVARGESFSLQVSVGGSPSLRYQWFKDGFAIAGATYSSISVNNASLTDVGKYHVRIANDVGSAVSSIAEVALVNATRPIFTDSGGNQTFGTDSYIWLYPGVSGGSPITYQWYKDGVAIAGATSMYYSKANPTIDDAGVYYVTATNDSGMAVSADYVLTFAEAYSGAWLDSVRVGDIVYFLATAPARIMRYNLANESWLPIVYLSETKVPSAFCPTGQEVFIAYGNELVRRTVDLTQETPVSTSSQPIRSIWVFGDFVYFGADYQVFCWNRQTLVAGPTTSNLSDTHLSTRRVLPSSVHQKLYTTRLYSNGVGAYSFNPTGTLGGFTSSSSTIFTAGDRQYLSNDETVLFDNSGVVYTLPGLTYTAAMGGAFADLATTSSGKAIALRGKTLTAYVGDRWLPAGSYTLTSAARALASKGSNLFAFGAPTNAASNPIVTKVAESSLVVDPPQTAPTAAGLMFSPDYTFTSSDGVVHLVSRSARAVLRWDAIDRTFLSSIPLRRSPGKFSFSPATDQLVLAYSDGALSRLDFATDGAETIFGAHSPLNRLLSMVAMDDLTALQVYSTNSSAEARIVLDATGQSKFVGEAGYYGQQTLAWNSTMRRLYSGGSIYSSGVDYVTVPTTGVIPASREGINTALTGPLRITTDGALILSGGGRVTNANLQQVGALTNAVVDGVWLSDGLFTIRAGRGGTEIQKWARITYELQSSTVVAGAPISIASLPNDKLVVTTLLAGRVAFFVLDSSLAIASSDYNQYVVTPTNAISHGATGRRIAAAPGTTIAVSHTVQNVGGKAWGSNHYLIVRDATGQLVADASLNGVAFGSSKSVTFNLTAPPTIGSHRYTIDAVENGTNGTAESFGTRVPFTLEVAASAPDLSLQGHTFPATARGGDTVNFQVTVANVGPTDWGNSHFFLVRDWEGTPIAEASLADIPAGGTRTLNLSLVVPDSAGVYSYRMRGTDNGGAGDFGDLATFALTVTGSATNGITYNSSSFVKAAAPGALVAFSFDVTNSGTKDWASNHFLLLRDGNRAPLADSPLGFTAVGTNRTAALRFTAPSTPGVYAYYLRAVQNGKGEFGPEITLLLQVPSAAVSDISYPAQVIETTAGIGSTVSLSLPVTNSGSKVWGANHYLLLRNSARSPVADASLSGTAIGGQRQTVLRFTAPSSAGSYRYYMRAVENGGIGDFGPEIVVNLTVVARSGITYDSNTFPTSAVAGSTVSFNVGVTNSGSKAWGANHYLLLRNGSRTPWADASLATTFIGANRTATLHFTAPTTPGTYTYSLGAIENGGDEAFGEELTFTLTVPADSPNNIAYGDDTFPDTAAIGTLASFTIQVTNTGTQAWGANHFLLLRKSDGTPWAEASLAGIAAGQSATKTLRVRAASSAGNETFTLRAVDNNGEGEFGPRISFTWNVPDAPANAITYGTVATSVTVTSGSQWGVTVPVTNSGSRSWGSNHFLLLRDQNGVPYADSSLYGIAAAEGREYGVGGRAPTTPGTYTYRLRAVENGGEGEFGTEITITLVVTAEGLNGLSYGADTFPVYAVANSTVNFTVHVTNTGNTTWNSDYFLLLRDSFRAPYADASLSGLAPGQSRKINVSFRAPATPGSHRYYLHAVDNGRGLVFGSELIFDLIVPSGGYAAASFGDFTFPATAAAGSQVSFTVPVINIGTLDLTPANYFLRFRPESGSDWATVPLTVSVGATATTTVTFTAPQSAGTYTLSLAVFAPDRISYRVPLTLTVTTSAIAGLSSRAMAPMTYSQWARAHFTTDELFDEAITAPDTVYGADGLTNLLKYALGLDPKQDGTAWLPQTTTVDDHWFYTYRRPTNVNDVTYRVEVSADLINWTDVGVTQEMTASDSAWQTWQAQYHGVAGQTVIFRLVPVLE